MKKIFFVADAQQIHTAKWVDYFLDNGYEVHLATFTKNRTKAKNVYCLSENEKDLKGGNFYYFLHIKDLANILKEVKPDIINAHFSYSLGFITLLALKIAKIDTEFSIVCHGSDVLKPPMPQISQYINKYVLHNSDKIFAVSSQIRDKIESFGVDLNSVFLGQYGISVEAKEVEKDIDLISNRTYEPNSQIELMLDYLQELNDLNLKIVFVLPDIKDHEYDTLVKNYPNVEFYKPMPYKELISLVNRSKIYISATKSDGLSLSLLEAMQLRCVPIVSDIVSNRSVILDGINGFLFYNKNQFLEKIKHSLENYEIISNKFYYINKYFLDEHGNYQKQMKKIEEFLINS